MFSIFLSQVKYQETNTKICSHCVQQIIFHLIIIHFTLPFPTAVVPWKGMTLTKNHMTRMSVSLCVCSHAVLQCCGFGSAHFVHFVHFILAVVMLTFCFCYTTFRSFFGGELLVKLLFMKLMYYSASRCGCQY